MIWFYWIILLRLSYLRLSFIIQDPSKFAAAAAPAAAARAAPVAAAKEEKKEEPAEESDDDMGLSLFD